MMPRALPSTTTTSSISWRLNISHRAGGDLALERLVGADEQLLAGLAAGVERARDLDAAEGAVVEQAAVLAGERDALGDALVDDVRADLGEAIDVGLARAVVAALDGVVEEAERRVPVLLVVLGRVDAALGGDRVGASRRVLVAEGLHDVARLTERRRGGATGEAGADDDDRQLAAVGRVDERGVELARVPALLDGTRGRLGVLDRLTLGVQAVDEPGHGRVGLVEVVVTGQLPLTIPKRMASGGRAKPTLVTSAITSAGGLGAPARGGVAGPAQRLGGAPDAVVEVQARGRRGRAGRSARPTTPGSC